MRLSSGLALAILFLGSCKKPEPTPVETDTDTDADADADSDTDADTDSDADTDADADTDTSWQQTGGSGGSAAPPCNDDAFEPNDDVTTAMSMASGSALIVCASSNDMWAFDVPDGQILTVDVTFDSSVGNIDVDLLDENNTATLDISWGMGDSEQVQWYNGTGANAIVNANLYLWLTTAETEYAFTSTLTPCGADSLEPNDDIASATTDGNQTGLTMLDADVDVFEYIVPAGDALEVQVLFSNAVGDLDAELVDANGTVLATANSGDDDERLLYYNSTGAEVTVYARVFPSPLGTVGCMSYDIGGSTTPVVCNEDAHEPNDTLVQSVASAGELGLGIVIGNPDWWQVQAPAGEQLRIEAIVDPLEVGVTLEVRNSNLDVVGTTNPTLYANAGAVAETVYVAVRADENGPGVCGAYDLDLTTVPCINEDGNEPNDDIVSASAVSNADDLFLNVGNDDWFALGTVPPAGTIDNILMFSGNADIDTELLDGNGQVLAASGTVSPVETINYTNATAADQDVFLHVFFWNNVADTCSTPYSIETTITP
ncbi:MAG: hypothetical protein H6737_26730 [Alphaproteobacteria bacterium]|nr:hypothetical protein [Alphaproteobacteria bacterium]